VTIENISLAAGQDPQTAGAAFADGLSREALRRIAEGLRSLEVERRALLGDVTRLA
jgi:hypothetical protein